MIRPAASRVTGGHQLDVLPGTPVQAAQQPQDELPADVVVGQGQRQHERGEGGVQAADRDARQQQGADWRLAAPRGDAVDDEGGEPGRAAGQEGQGPDGVGGQAEIQGNDRSQSGAGRHP